MHSTTTVAVRSTPFELVTSDLSESQVVLLTNLLAWLLALVSGIFLGLRLFAVWYRKLVLVVDDGLLIAAWVMVLFYATMTSLELAAGVSSTGPSASTTSTAGASPAVALLDNAARTVALTAVAWSKSAFACGLLGLRPVRAYRWCLLAMVGVLNALVVGAAVFHWVRCRPVSRAWDADVAGVCFGVDARNGVQIGAQAYFAFMDMVLVGMGYMLVWSENLRRGEKFGIGLLASQGVFASVASIITAVEISTLTNTTTFISNTRVLLAASLEAPLTIMISSLPALQLLRTRGHAPRKQQQHGASPHSRGTTAATPTDNPFSGFRPPRPARPSSARSFLTEASSRSQLKPAAAAAEPWVLRPGAAIITTNITGGPGAAATKPLSPAEDLLPGIEYDFKRWNPAATTTENASMNAGGGGGSSSNKPSPPAASFPLVAPSPRGGLFAITTTTSSSSSTSTALPPTTMHPNQNQNPGHRRPSTGRSNTSNNSTTALLAARDYLSSTPSPPSSPSSPLSSAGIGGLFPRPAATVVGSSNGSNNYTSNNNNLNNTSSSSNNNNIDNRRLTIVREEAAVPSWGSSAARSSADRASSLLDLYATNTNTNGNDVVVAGAHSGSAAAAAATAAAAGGSGSGHVPMRSRDSPTLGDWSGWAASGRRGEEEEPRDVGGAGGGGDGPGLVMTMQQQQQQRWQQQQRQQQHQQQRRFPVNPSIRPLHARQRLPPETGPTAPAGWAQRAFGGV